MNDTLISESNSTAILNGNGHTAPVAPLTKKDFENDQTVRWCPGCGDYVVLATVQKVLPELGIPKEKFAFISGIGCSSRFPYYMNTYGFHTIHGRATAVATGLKAIIDAGGIGLVQNPETAYATAMPLAALKTCPQAKGLTLENIAVYLKGVLTP